MRLKLTKAVIEAIEPPEQGTLFVRDSEVPGFALRVTATGARSFVVERKVGGKTVRRTVGRFGVLPLPDARSEAMSMLARMAAGETPEHAGNVKTARRVTLRDAFEEYVRERTSVRPGLKELTAYKYRQGLERNMPDWLDMGIDEITRNMVAERHGQITRERSDTMANQVMRTLSAVMNYASDNDDYVGADGQPLVPASPVMVLKQRRLWNRERRRTTYLDEHSLPHWWRMVDDVTPEFWPDRAAVMRDYWRFLLLTGMRSEEGARLPVKGVDLQRGTIRVEALKNGDTYVAPVGPWLLELLRRRVKEARRAGTPWVFPAPKRPQGYTSSGHDIREALIVKHGLHWSPHDLRRTYATVLDSLDVSHYAIKRLLGHRSGGDVTAGYVQADVSRLRAAVERVEARLLELCQVQV